MSTDARIIPAYAGSTRPGRCRPVRRQDHPRIRGEHFFIAVLALWWVGSSPHTRGALAFLNVDTVQIRIIPAYAGSTASPTWAPTDTMDHPRIRGEHPPGDSVWGLLPGSSPHTRGARRYDLAHHVPHRIIPAYAGSTTLPSNALRICSDHPRIRGEHATALTLPVFVMGSSPHTRGAPSLLEHGIDSRRIIPAYAGSTYQSPDDRGRACGSSPHTRGAPGRSSPKRPRWRIIPAYAGSTRQAILPVRSLAHHPRIRGEHTLRSALRCGNYGSSPHTRGARRF